MFKKSSWKYDTSEEEGSSFLVFSGANGTIWFTDPSTGEGFSVWYTYFAAGPAKGAVWNYAKALKTDPSDGFSHVRIIRGGEFGPDSFPCTGWMLMGAATAGIFQPSFLAQSGAETVLAFFGTFPFAVIPYWGRFNSLMPSAGTAMAVCHFGKAQVS